MTDVATLHPIGYGQGGSIGGFHDSLPRYARIADALIARIRSGAYPTDSFLPAESKLSWEFAVSRGTVRQAISVLQTRGFVRAEVGRGTRVLAPQPPSQVFELPDFNKSMLLSGRTPSTRLLHRDVLPASADVAARLGILPAPPVIRLVRLRLADGVPLVYETRFLALDTCPELLQEDVEHQSVHHLLLDRYGIPLVQVDLTIRLAPLSHEAAEFLAQPPATPVFCLERVTYRSDGVPVTWFHAYYHSDHFALTIFH